MARPRKDKFEEVSYGFVKGSEHELVEVSLPFWLNATVMDKYNHGTTTQPVCELRYSKDQIRELFQQKELKVIKFEPFTTKLPNFCERCGRTGTPTILKKSNYDLRHRTRTENPTRNNRPDEYRLVYQHKDGKKMCIIAIFDVGHLNFKNPKGRIIELHKHFFPRYLEKMKIQYGDLVA